MNRTPKLSQGLITFGIVVIVMLFVIAPIQYFFGAVGLAVSELIFLIIAVTAALICKCDLKAVFKFRLPPIKQFFGGALFYGGTYLLVTAVLLVTALIFPQIYDVADAISDYSDMMSPAGAVFVMAFLPALCEEALHRGFILSSFSNVKRKWVVVLSMGVIFGIFHLDPYRFLPTAMLGAAFTYIALETDSIVLTMLFHFLNNLVSVVSMYAVTDTDMTAEAELLSDGMQVAVSCGFYTVLGFAIAFAGYRLLKGRKTD